MLQPDDRTRSGVFPLRFAAVLLFGSIGASWWLVPRQDELVERLFMDKQYERLAAHLRESLGGAAPSSVVNLRNVSADQLAALSHLLRLTPREQLRTIFAEHRPFSYDIHTHALVLAAIRYVDVIPPAEVWAMIQRRMDDLPSEFQAAICNLVADNAMAGRNPTLAATVLSHAAHLPDAPWTVVREMAQAYRWSGQAGKGARELRDLMRAKTFSLDQFAALFQLGRELALEGGDASLAFEFSIAEFRRVQAAGGSILAEQIEGACDLAVQSSRTRELLPWLQPFVNKLPQWSADADQLRRDAARQDTSMAAFRHWCGLLARFCDWNCEFETAYDCHWRLALAGDVTAFDRCIELDEFLGRDEETVALIEALRPFEPRPRSRLALARMLAALGRDADARPHFEAWITTHPDDRDARFDLASLLEDMGDEEAAMAEFARLVERFPADVPAIKKLAECRIRAGQHREALQLHASLKEADHDAHTLEAYSLLAESLDEHQHLVCALRLMAERRGSPSVGLYLDIAEAAARLENPQGEIDVLAEAVQRIPESVRLRIALATAWLKNENVEQAFAVLLEGRSLKSHPEAVILALEIAPQARDPQRILDFVGPNVEKQMALPDPARLDLAVLCRLCGDSKRAEQVFASVSETRDNLVLIAEARHAVGDDEDAARLMFSHIDGNALSTADDWLFLGEVYEALGRIEEAKRAYDNSLALLTADLPGTAFVPSGSAATSAKP